LSCRPIYHSKDDRIRSHVLLCWLALLLVRMAEVETGESWPRIRRLMQQQNLVDLLGRSGRILQHTELTPAHVYPEKTLNKPQNGHSLEGVRKEHRAWNSW